MQLSARDVLELLELRPHPVEGGFFRETYRSSIEWASAEGTRPHGSRRSLSTAIYYLLTPETFSALHRVPGDEAFHFYCGDPVEMLLLAEERAQRIVLGTDLRAGMRPQVVVPGGTWQGARLRVGGSFALLGTTMAPGFDFADLELGPREELVARYPEAAREIERLTRER